MPDELAIQSCVSRLNPRNRRPSTMIGTTTAGTINSTNPDEIKAAYEWLKALKPSVRVFDVTATKQAFISEEVVAGLAWNGDAFIARVEATWRVASEC